MASGYDKKVKLRRFNGGDLVLKKVLPFKEYSYDKFKPNYDGPYIVNKDLSSGALILSKMDEDVLHEQFNFNFVNILYDDCSHSLEEMTVTIFLYPR